MLAFLSPEWIEALDEALAADAAVARLTEHLDLTIEQEVAGGPDGDVSYHLAFVRGEASVRPGPAPEATVRLSQDLATAAAIATGATSAQRAFMAGHLRIGGDLRVLLDHGDVLAQVSDVFAAVRDRTDFPDLG